MSLMVNPVSAVNFCSQTNNVDDILARPGAFARPAEPLIGETAPKKHKFLKFIAGTLLTIGIVAGALYGLKHHFQLDSKVINLEGLEGFEKFKAYAKKAVAIGGELVDSAGQSVKKYCWEEPLKLLKTKKTS